MPLIPVVAVTTLKRQALRKGVMGPSTGWKIVAVFAFGGPIVRRLVSKQTDVLTIETLKPGESVNISTYPALTRAERKQAKRARRAS